MIHLSSKITIIEGPDCAGKTHAIQNLKNTIGDEIELIVLRFPDNRADVPIRDLLFQSSMTDYRMGAAFLFLADFLHGFEKDILPKIDNPNVRFVFDRFVPSLCVYQDFSLNILNRIFEMDKFAKFAEIMRDAHYIFLNPVDKKRHLERVASSKKNNDRNAYDPETWAEIEDNINVYQWFFGVSAKDHSILGSTNITTIEV